MKRQCDTVPVRSAHTTNQSARGRTDCGAFAGITADRTAHGANRRPARRTTGHGIGAVLVGSTFGCADRGANRGAFAGVARHGTDQRTTGGAARRLVKNALGMSSAERRRHYDAEQYQFNYSVFAH